MANVFGFGVDSPKSTKTKSKKQRTKDVETKPSTKKKRSTDKTLKKVIKVTEKIQKLPSYPVALSDNKRKKISKLDDEAKLASIIGSSAEDIQDFLEKDDKERATSLIYKRLLQTLVDMVPHAENTVRTTKGFRGVYQLNILISSIRELIADQQSALDRGRLGESLIEKILRPAFMDLGMHIITEFTAMGEDAKGLMKADDYIRFKKSMDRSRAEIGRLLNQQYAGVKDEVSKFFQQ